MIAPKEVPFSSRCVVGVPQTLVYHRRFVPAPDVEAAVCRSCGIPTPSTKHCTNLSPHRTVVAMLPQVLRFVTAEGQPDFAAASITKDCLQKWWQMTLVR